MSNQYCICAICKGECHPFIDDMEDFEYGVNFKSLLVKCSNCGLITHEPPITKDKISSLYPESYLAHSSASGSSGIYGRMKKVLADHSLNSILKLVPQNGVVIEVGSGNASFLQKIDAVRPDIRLIGVDIVKTDHSDQFNNYEFIEGQFEDILIEKGIADLIYFSNLIEHVADPRLFLNKCATTLKDNGWIYGVTPDHLSIDRYIFRKYWAGYHYPRHTFIFNHNNLKMLFQQCGFEQCKVKGSYSFWYLSLMNATVMLPGTKKRGLLFALTTAVLLPVDILINLVRPHGSLSFAARIPRIKKPNS